jgi:hypothetical protein
MMTYEMAIMARLAHQSGTLSAGRRAHSSDVQTV